MSVSNIKTPTFKPARDMWDVTLWDMYAAAALSGLASDFNGGRKDLDEAPILAEYAARLADAMLETREKRKIK